MTCRSLRNLFSLKSAWGAVLTGLILSVSVPNAGAENWTAPVEESAKSNPDPAGADSIVAGKTVYGKRCAGCHGNAGNGDGPDAADLGIHPAKLSQLDPNAETDGALFWKISTGKKPMPKYSAKLSAAEIWQVINYLRTFRNQ